MKQYLLGIDIGTSSIKLAVIDEDMHTLSYASKSYEVEHPKENWSQIKASVLWSGLLSCLNELRDKVNLSSIHGIGLSCMSPGLVAIDCDNNILVDPILYSDRRSVEEEEWIKAKVGEGRIFELTANNLMAGAISVTSMLWIKNKYPDIYAKTRWFGHINTLFSILLTGKPAIDPSNASYTGLFETAGKRQWSIELCRSIGINIDKLPPIVASDNVCGFLTSLDVIALGVPVGTPVVIGGADSPCASIACGVTSHGDACESVGTTNVLSICVEEPVFCREFINRCHVVADKWLYQGALSNVGASVKWSSNILCQDLMLIAKESGENLFTLMDNEAARSAPGASGVLFLPYLTGERCPIWNPNARGVFFGMTLETKRCDMVRAVLESCCYGMKQLLEILQKRTGMTFDSFDSVGGGAKSIIWTQMKSDITGKTIRILDSNEASVMGAAMLAGVGIGVFHDLKQASKLVKENIYQVITPKANEKTKKIFDARYKTYLDIYQKLKPLFDNKCG